METENPITVSVRGARLLYRDVALFDGLDVTLKGGTWTCVLGPSGVGKSSLLRYILGLEAGAADAGSVTCSDGLAVSGRAAFMAQEDLLLPWLTVLDNLMLGHRLRGHREPGPQNTERAMSLLADVGLTASAGERPDTLSGGMRQRAALARTLMEDRPIVLMDEPFSALDAISRVRHQDLAARLLAGKTVMLVTHDPLEALRLGHRIHVLADRPARLGDAITPPGSPPRPLDDPAVLETQGELLSRLAEAAA